MIGRELRARAEALAGGGVVAVGVLSATIAGAHEEHERGRGSGAAGDDGRQTAAGEVLVHATQ